MSNIIAMAIAALLSVESSNGSDLRNNDGGRAAGILQQWEISVREANRIVGYDRWTYADRNDPVETVAMCRVTLAWHWRRGVRDPVKVACRWRNPHGDAPGWYRQRIREAIRKGQRNAERRTAG